MNKDRELNLLVDLESGRIWVPKMGTHLTPSEIRLLAVLNRREGRPTPLEFLINELNRSGRERRRQSPLPHIQFAP